MLFRSYLFFTGVFLGATISVKWSGLSFIAALYGFWLVAYISKKLFLENLIFTKTYSDNNLALSPTEQIEQIKFYQLAIFLPLIIYATYFLAWQPHLKQNPGTIKEVETQIYNFHKSYANRPQEHPYTSAWYSWPMMIRPVCYFYETVKNPNEIIPNRKTPLPLNEVTLVYDIHAMGNPLLYWFAIISLFALAFVLCEQYYFFLKGLIKLADKRYLAINFFVPLYLIISYSANLFSWAGVSRFTFLYHYMPASIFSFLALAWLVDYLLASKQKTAINLSISIILIISISFLFFLPVYLGLPISPRGFFLRMWLPSWI